MSDVTRELFGPPACIRVTEVTRYGMTVQGTAELLPVSFFRPLDGLGAAD